MDARQENVDTPGEAQAPVSATVTGNALEQLREEAPPSSPRSGLQTFTVLSTLYLTLFTAAWDTTVVTTALPTIAHHFHSAAGYTWVGAAYLLTDTAFGPVWTSFSDIWGRKPVLLASVALFMASSLVCGLATSMAMLIAGRALQGTAAGAIILLVNIVISDLFDMRSRSLYLGLCELIWALSGAVGPLIGGAFAEYVSWRWIWYINLPTSGFAFVMLAVFLDVHTPKTPLWPGLKAIDWLGSCALLTMAIMVLLGLNLAGDGLMWTSSTVLSLITIGLAAAVVFFFVEVKVAKHPVMPLGLFRSPSNAATMALVAFHGFSMMGAEYYLPLFFQSAKLARPLHAGSFVLPFVCLEAVGGVAAGIVINRTGRYRILICIGVVAMTAGYGMFTDLKPSTGLAKILIYQSAAALGTGVLLQPPLTAIQAAVEQDDTASATATLGFVRSVAQVMSLVVGSVVFSRSMDLKTSSLTHDGLTSTAALHFAGSQAQANVNEVSMIERQSTRGAVQAAYAWSLRNVWIVYAASAATSMVAAIFVRSYRLSTTHVETRTGLKQQESKAGEKQIW